MGEIIGIVWGFLTSWLNFRRDRSNLKITLKFHLKTGRGTSFSVYLVNKGRRPVSVNEVLLRLKSNEAWLPSRGSLDSPIKLEETESREICFPLYDVRDKISTPLDIRCVEVKDTAGKKYTQGLSRRLRAQIRREWTAENDWLKRER